MLTWGKYNSGGACFNPTLFMGAMFSHNSQVAFPEGARVRFLLLLFVSFSVCFADPLADLLERGVPARSALVGEEALLIEITGSLSRGDSLLKHYGGAFFLLLDSIAGGWPLMGLEVRIPGSSLVLFREDVFEALSLLGRGADEQALASWVLEHTWVIHLEN